MKENKSIQQLNARSGSFYFAFAISLYVIVSFLGQAIMGAITEKNGTLYVAVCSTFSALSFLIAIAYAFFGEKINAKNIVGESYGVKLILPALLLSCGMFFGLGYVNSSIATIFKGWGLTVSEFSVPLSSPWHLVVFSITLALLPAIAEELFFRGIILNSLSGVKKIYAVLISGLCFALYHCSVAQLVYQFIYGVALGFLFLSAKSILPCIIAHFTNNFTVLCLQYFNANVNLFNVKLIILGAICLAIFSAVMYLTLKNNKKAERLDKKGEITKFFFPYALFAIIVCIALAVSSLVS